jgi:hypothetical protein
MEQSIPFFKTRLQYVYVMGGILLIALLAVALSYWPLSINVWSTFTTVFLGIFIEAMPFLFIGTLASGVSGDSHQTLQCSVLFLGAC